MLSFYHWTYLWPSRNFKSFSDNSRAAIIFGPDVDKTTYEQIFFAVKSLSKANAHEQTIICRQLFADHVVGSRPVERKKKCINW